MKSGVVLVLTGPRIDLAYPIADRSAQTGMASSDKKSRLVKWGRR